jgi:3-oxoacyl-[acyl-carrier-protein] synthase II
MGVMSDRVTQKRRVVVTGVGVIAATGIGTESFWKGLLTEPGVGPHEVKGWDPEPLIPRKESRRLDRFSQFALGAAAEALDQAGELTADPDRVAVSIATGIGGLASLEELIQGSYEEGTRVSPLLIPMMMCNAAAAAISIKYGFGGPATTQVVACAAGAQAISDAFRAIQWGYADAALAGGAEGAVRRPTEAGFAAAKALSPSGIARPFSVDRDGFVLGEGAALLVLEELEQARSRGARILAEVGGAASTADAHHITAPHPTGNGAERAIHLALQDAGLRPSNDLTEGMVIARVFGEDQPLVSSIKGTTGHALGASGAIEAASAVLAIDRHQLPPNIGLTAQDPEIPLTRIVREPLDWIPGPVVSNSFGFGGHNAVLVITPYFEG